MFLESLNTILATNAEVFTGGYDRAKSNNQDYFESEYNTGFFFNDQLKLDDYYHKRILIPFGEKYAIWSVELDLC